MQTKLGRGNPGNSEQRVLPDRVLFGLPQELCKPWRHKQKNW